MIKLSGIKRTDVGTIDVEDVIAALPEEERAWIEARAAELLAEQATLQDLRRAFELTQSDLAKKLGVGQDAISRLEKRSDMLLSTLRSYVAALGGELSLVASFPDRPPVKIETLEWIVPEREGEASQEAAADARVKRSGRGAAKAAR